MLHVDVSDHRGFENIGRFDWRNVVLAFQHALRLGRVLYRDRPGAVYLPLAQNRLGLGRDLLFEVLALAGGAKVIAHVHGGGFGAFLASSPAWFRIPARHLLMRCSVMVVMSDWQRERVEQALPGAPMAVVPHGTQNLDVAHRDPVERPLNVIYVSSSLRSAKGTRTALEAARIAQESGVTSAWKIVGAWRGEGERLQAEEVVRGVAGISFVGALTRDELLNAYLASDVFVFPTTGVEGFGLVRIEAMSAALPVITTPAGGAHEIVRDGVDGFIVEYESPDQIVTRLEELRAQPDRRIKMGLSAQERQRELFSEAGFERALGRVWRNAVSPIRGAG